MTSIQPPYVLFAAPELPRLERVSQLGKTAGLVMWSDADTAANCLRRALESVVHDLYDSKPEVPSKNKKNARLPLGNLVKDINRLGVEEDDQTILDTLVTVGNSGSHGDESEVTLEELINAGRDFTSVMESLYPNAGRSGLE